jgi:S-formylglutathione hydrolase FrmB
MALLTLEFKSEVLVKATRIKIVLNQNAKPPYPTFYLLHGLSDDESIWTRRTSIERYAENYPFLIVMPDGGRGWYCDSRLGRYESFITRELIAFVDKLFPTRKQARYRAIGGLSMGGYGALKLGLKFPRVFGSITAHSSAVGFLHAWGLDGKSDIPEMPSIAADVDPNANDIYQLAAQCPANLRPNLYFDCGRDDFLYRDNDHFERSLRQQKIPHTYRRFDGIHDWAYWDIHIQDALKFHAKGMDL